VELSADALHARGGEARKHHYGIEEAREAKAQWCGWMDGIEQRRKARHTEQEIAQIIGSILNVK
jgi:hypothetical protein